MFKKYNENGVKWINFFYFSSFWFVSLWWLSLLLWIDMAKAMLIKEHIYLGLVYSFRCLLDYHLGEEQGGRNTNRVLEKQLRATSSSTCSRSKRKRKRQSRGRDKDMTEREGEGVRKRETETQRKTGPVMRNFKVYLHRNTSLKNPHILQQGHTATSFSNSTTFWWLEFKYMNLGGPFLFKSP